MEGLLLDHGLAVFLVPLVHGYCHSTGWSVPFGNVFHNHFLESTSRLGGYNDIFHGLLHFLWFHLVVGVTFHVYAILCQVVAVQDEVLAVCGIVQAAEHLGWREFQGPYAEDWIAFVQHFLEGLLGFTFGEESV